MVYEIGDPAAYILPDVIVDMRNVRITADEKEKDKVWVEGARGTPPTPQYKVSVTYMDGYKIGGELLLAGYDAKEKVCSAA
tara:strand:- start:19 stop:261 length:243 start_codon:yes stop_codon:yes gene_type:complete